MPDLLFQNLVLQLRIRRDRIRVDRSDHVERPEIAFVRGRIGLDRAHDDSVIDPFEQLPNLRVIAEGFDSNPEPRAHDLAAGD
ncbi:MAG: hypothetical protein DME57_10715 [Verrucomicrobia bacterium]|nr:MAG: hypothetical protein DME57_10715 [Verrucomicrobiota bacterium]